MSCTVSQSCLRWFGRFGIQRANYKCNNNIMHPQDLIFFIHEFKAIGVDLGTTFSVVCINLNGKVIVIEDNSKNRLFPSIVAYSENGGRFWTKTVMIDLSLMM